MVKGIDPVMQPKLGKRGARWLRSKYADWILVCISAAESIFAPILIDPFLVALIFANRAKWKWYIFISIAASVVGGLIAYALGALFYETIGVTFVGMYGLESQFQSIQDNLNENGFVFVLIGAFTPIPYKLVALASGVLHINIFTFLVASFFGRIFRLGLVGFAAYAVGPKALPIMQRNLWLLAAVVGVMLVIYILFRAW